ncbi:MAG TPA: hypothetical protein VJ302_07225 [Blastocatellia bacterium]|nr:hypothetical protein [Blastocatellia bacterium]
MTGSRERLVKFSAALACTILVVTTIAMARQQPRPDPLGFLKHVLVEVGAPALTSDQETQLKTLVTNLHTAQSDETLKTARTAYTDAILAGDLDAAAAQATIVSNRMAELSKTRMQTMAKFQIDVIAVLKNGGQLEPLKSKFGSERLVEMIGHLVGGPPLGPGRPGFGPGGFGPGGFGPPPPEKFGKE